MTERSNKLNGHEREPSRLLKYLPAIYTDDPFLSGLLQLFDSFWLPLDREIGQLYRYFDPTITPTEFLPWLGTWVDLVLDENWPEARRRALVRHAADLYRRRGTASGLRDYLALYLNQTPEIDDGDETRPFHFTVTFRLPDPTTVDQDRIRRIIDEAKPGYTTYTLRLEKA